jgi:hypothetical protein
LEDIPVRCYTRRRALIYTAGGASCALAASVRVAPLMWEPPTGPSAPETPAAESGVTSPRDMTPASPALDTPAGASPAGDDAAGRVLYCVPGAWTDAWYDNPVEWRTWCSAFLGWSAPAWSQFLQEWRLAGAGERERLMCVTGLRFFDWRRVPGGSVKGLSRTAAAQIADDLARLPAGSDVTLLGHSKGGNAVAFVLAAHRDWAQGAQPARAVVVGAPVDAPRQLAGRLLGLGIERCRLSQRYLRVPCATVNNWLDPSGGRSRGARNYQTLVWQDHLEPYPPHGLKDFLAERVLSDLGALPPAGAPR